MRFDCGPVAVLNVLKWFGWKVTYKKDIKRLMRECRYTNTDKFKGVQWKNVVRAVKKLGDGKLRVKVINVDHIDPLKEHLELGGAFILRHHITNKFIHYSTVVLGKNCKFRWVNSFHQASERNLTPENFENEVMSTQGFGNKIIAILVSKSRVEGSRKYSGPGTGRKRRKQK